jgi:regulator of sigma E protease
MHWLTSLLGIALLMVVHESGHYFIARAFGMRVERFAIGIGPTIWRHQPKDSDTIFQVGLIPFLAYVQIAGLNPFEEVEPDDEGSFANATLTGRISAIIAGPLANYLSASLLFFGAIIFAGQPSGTTEVTVREESAAAVAGIKDGDHILAIDGKPMAKWEDIPPAVQPHPGKKLTVEVRRGQETLSFSAIPDEMAGKGLLGVSAVQIPVPWSEVKWKEAALKSIEQPAKIVLFSMEGIGRMITGQEKPQLSGPLGLMRETKKASEAGFSSFLWILGFLSTAVGFFNMLPFPALDGGRLMFLGYEAITRRRPNQKVEAQIHTVGMIMLLTTLVLVTYREWGTDKTPSEQAAESKRKGETADEKTEGPGSAGKPGEKTAPPVKD